MATHSSILAWRIPGTGEPGGLPSMGSHRVGHDWSDLTAAAAAQAQTVTCASISPRFPQTLSSGTVNLQEGLLELRVTFYRIHHQFITKGYSSTTVRWERCIWWGIWQVGGAQSFHALCSPRISTCSPIWELSKPSPSGFLWKFHYKSMTD